MRHRLIKEIVDQYFKIDISEPTRKVGYVEARALYYKLCRKHSRLSLEVIGEYVGKDHATAINGIKKLEGWMEYDKRMQCHYSELSQLVREGLEHFDDDEGYITLEDMYQKRHDALVERYETAHNSLKEDYINLNEKYNRLIHMFNFLKSQLVKYQPTTANSDVFKVETNEVVYENEREEN